MQEAAMPQYTRLDRLQVEEFISPN